MLYRPESKNLENQGDLRRWRKWYYVPGISGISPHSRHWCGQFRQNKWL